MYCRNCGNQINNHSVVCKDCYVPVCVGVEYCQKCGAKTEKNSEKCENCGAELEKSMVTNKEIFRKSKTMAQIMSLFGVFGLENFYLGYTKKGIIQLVLSITVVGLPVSIVWGVVDFCMLSMGKINRDAYGMLLK